MNNDPVSIIAVITHHSDGSVTAEQWEPCDTCVKFLRHVLGPPAASAIADHAKMVSLSGEAGVVILDHHQQEDREEDEGETSK